jgi:hypothetical protein
METNPVSDMLCFSPENTGRWKKSKTLVILCAMHHRQNPLKSNWKSNLETNVDEILLRANHIYYTLMTIFNFLRVLSVTRLHCEIVGSPMDQIRMEVVVA